MNTDTDLHWHADDDLLAAYVAGRTHPPVTASVEMHLMGCGHCRSALAPLVDPAPLRGVWDRVADELQAPPRTRTERVAARLGLSDRDALLVAAAPALRGSWLLALLLCLLFSVTAVTQGEVRGGLAFLCIAPLLPVGAVAFAYGQEADPIWEVTLAAPYPPLRLLLLRAVSVVVVALPLAFVAAPVLPGPPWVGGCLAAAGLRLRGVQPSPSPPGSRSSTPPAPPRWGGSPRSLVVAGPAQGHAVAVLAAPVLPVYLAIGLVASVTFWMRSDRLSFLGRTP